MKAIRIMLLGIAIMIFGAAFVAANTETSFSEATYIGIALRAPRQTTRGAFFRKYRVRRGN